jgi:hypothetical protein
MAKENERQQPALATDHYSVYIGSAGVTLVDMHDEAILFLSPKESLELARLILEREQELQALENKLAEQYEQISQAVLSAFHERVAQSKAELREQRPLLDLEKGLWDYLDFEQELIAVLNRLIAKKEGVVWQWYQSISTDRYLCEQHEALFWRYFSHTYRDKVVRQHVIPEDSEAEFFAFSKGGMCEEISMSFQSI